MPYNTTAIPPRTEPTGQTQLPLSRVRRIVSQDPEIEMCSNSAAFVITLAAELFIQHIATEAHTQAKVERRSLKSVQYKDVANAIFYQENLEFLRETVPRTMPFKKAMAAVNSAQARLRGEKVTADDGLQSTHKSAAKKDNNSMLVNGDGAHFRVSLRKDNIKPDDAGNQLELEMRQTARVRDNDVIMS